LFIADGFCKACIVQCMFSGISLTYGGEALAAEIILIFILAGLEAVRIFLGICSILFFKRYLSFLCYCILHSTAS